MAVGTLIELSTLQAWQERLSDVYATHDLSYTYIVFDTEHPMSEDIKDLYQKFQSAYTEEHLAQSVKWTIDDGELDVGALIKWQTAEDVDTSLTSMEAQTHYTRTANTAGTTYTQTTHSNASTNGRTSHNAQDNYVQSTNSTVGTSYTRSYYSSHGSYTPACSATTHMANSNVTYTERFHSGNHITYSITNYTAGTTYSQASNAAATTYTES